MNIILVHGTLSFRSKFGVEYFRGVAEHPRDEGLKVLAPALDPMRGTIQSIVPAYHCAPGFLEDDTVAKLAEENN
jgi:hypothetical protein